MGGPVAPGNGHVVFAGNGFYVVPGKKEFILKMKGEPPLTGDPPFIYKTGATAQPATGSA
jgi:hypothetical protein